MLIFLSPGQGAQKPGMLSPWLEVRTSRKQLEALNDAVEFDLLEAGTSWDAERIRNTRIAQPLIFAASLVSGYAAIDAGVKPTAVCGHSVGEWSASVLAGVLSAQDAMRLVAARGTAMALACEEEPTGLAAVLGGERDAVIAGAIARGLAVANDNGPGQLVFGGTASQLEAFAATPPSGTRVRVLDVAGAFHTEAMHPAVSAVAALADTIHTDDANIPLISNRDGAALTNGRQNLDRMVDQIALPVRWDLVMDTLESIETTTTVELCPAGTLSAILRRRIKPLATQQMNTPADASTLMTADLRSGELTEATQ